MYSVAVENIAHIDPDLFRQFQRVNNLLKHSIGVDFNLNIYPLYLGSVW